MGIPEEPPPFWEEDLYGGDEDVYDDYDPPPEQDSPGKKEPSPSEEVNKLLLETIRALDGKDIHKYALPIVVEMQKDKYLPEFLGRKNSVWQSLLEVVIHECLNREAPFSITALQQSPLFSLYSKEVDELAKSIPPKVSPLSPHELWQSIREIMQRTMSHRDVKSLLQAFDKKESSSTLQRKFSLLPPPTTSKKVESKERAGQTAREVWISLASAKQQLLRLSMGFPSLDATLTPLGDPLGSIVQGEQTIFAAGTGTGKSSLSYAIVPALLQDIINWGKKNGLLVFCHTEEESVDKIRAFGMNPGGPNAHLADNLIVSDIGSSLERFVQTLYDTVIMANAKAVETGRPITEFLPYVVVLDYIQGIKPAGNEQEGLKKVAMLIKQGVQKWDISEFEKFSGVSFRDYAGFEWPEGQQDHRVAVVGFAQLNKPNEFLLNFKADSKEHPLSSFALEDESDDPVWRGPDGRGYLWEVREGDMRMLGRSEITGTSEVLNHATTIIMLHRSAPMNNPAKRGEDGKMHLEDTRARLILVKTRTGANRKFVPLEFDLDSQGFRARHYDTEAQKLVDQGKWIPASSYTQPGDPLLPPRPVQDKLGSYTY